MASLRTKSPRNDMRRGLIASAAVVCLSCCFMALSPGTSSAQGTSKREVEEHIKVLKTSKKPEQRKFAITRLAELELVRRGVAKEATPVVAKCLKEPNADIRAAAAYALGVLGYYPETWVKDLGPLLSVKEKREVQLAAVITLGQTAKHGGFAVDALTMLRTQEMAKAEGKRDRDFLYALKDTLENIQQELVSMGPWYFIGPFPNDDNAGFKTAFPPEKEIDLKKEYPGKNAAMARWQKGSFKDGEVNNLALFGDENNTKAVVYLYREIECTQPREINVSLGSDDTLTVWLNGEKVVEEEVYRAAGPDQNKATLSLRQGKNALLIKICQGEGEWAFYFRMVGVKGK